MSADEIFMLSQPEEIIVSTSIEGPDKYLDELIAGAAGNEQLQRRLHAIKLLGQEEKVSWLQSLSDDAEPTTRVMAPLPPVVVCTMVTVVVVVMVVVGYEIVNGVKKIKQERREQEKQVRKCVRA